MKKVKLIFSFITILLVICTIALTVSAKNSTAEIVYIANEENANTKINSQQTKDGKTYLFLPSSADLSQLKLGADSKYTTITIIGDSSVTVNQGETFNLSALFENPEALNNEYNVTITLSPQAGKTITTSVLSPCQRNFSIQKRKTPQLPVPQT